MSTNPNHHPRPTDFSPADPSPSASVPDPLADLLAGGWVDQVLDRSRQEGHGQADNLYQQLKRDGELMRMAANNAEHYLKHSGTLPPQAIPKWIVRMDTNQFRSDPVLRLCLGQRWHIEDNDGDLRSAALKQYQEQPNEYDQILGDFIPADFRQEGHSLHAETSFDAGTNGTAADDWPVYRARLQQRRGQPLLGLSTGLPSLDLALRGLRGLTFLGGGTGVGKSTLALFIAAHALRKHPDLGVLFYSLDMPKTVLYDRLLSLEAGIDYGDLMADTVAQGNEERLDAAERRLHSEVLPRLRIIEHLSVPKESTLSQVMVDDLDEFLELGTLNEVLIVVDYFQLLPVPDEITGGLDADFYRVGSLQQVQEWSRTNANPVGYPILAISEVRKGESGRSEISVGDLMGSARLGYSAETVLLLESPRNIKEGPVVPVHLKVAKARDGAVRTQIDLVFEHTRSRFREAPRRRSPKQGGKSKKETSAQKPDQEKIDPLAGLEG
jgi:hypothetical protein